MALDKVIDSAKLDAAITATADAIRLKAGTTEKFPWEETTGFAAAVEAIPAGGGGSCEDVRYVTFMNDDGTVEYGKKAVAVGDDCADPIARGVFGTPTKESTAQYNYTFSGGWATTPGGGKDDSALKSVKEDRTVYANFIAAVRYYTITFYDSDGTTVLKTHSVAYGSTVTYTPSKDGFLFDGWVPALATVTGNASYTAKWAESVEFAAASWDTIAEKAADGTASQTWNIGDKKTIVYDSYNLTLVIAGFNHDDLADGTGKAGISIIFDSVPTDTYTWSNSSSSKPPYVSSSYVQSNLTKIFNKLPAELRSVIKPVTKQCDNTVDPGTGGSVITTINQSLWLLSATEMGYSKTSDSYYTALGNKYDYFTSVDNPLESGSQKFSNYECGNQTTAYWLRSTDRHGSLQQHTVTTSGKLVRREGSALYKTGYPYHYRCGFCI